MVERTIEQLDETLAHLTRKLLKAQRKNERVAGELSNLEKSVRELGLDRDRWRRRSEEAEATLKSMGFEIQK
jgi:chromosome segregation ATPase